MYDLLFLIAIYSSKNDNKRPSEKLTPQQSLYYSRSFSRFGTSFDDRPIILTCRQIFPNIVLLTNFPVKIKVSQAQNNWIVFKEKPSHKRGVQRSAHLPYK